MNRRGLFRTPTARVVLQAQPNTNTSAAWPNNLPYTSGGFSTAAYQNGEPQAGGFSAQYGYFQMTAELPTGAGLWPAFWLEPVNGTSACEIDIFEAPFNNPTLIQSSLHGGNGYTTGQVTVPNYSTNFNTYGVNWNAQTITYYVNGQVIGSTPTPASCNTPAFILANLAVGGTSWAWSGVPNSSNTWPANMMIQSITYNPNGPGGVGNDGGTYTGGLAEAGTIAATQPATTAAVTTPTPTPPATATAPAATDPPATAGSTPSTPATTAAPAAAATPAKTATTSAQQITPGSGSVTDCAGNTWTINSNNKILENDTPVLGGGDTAALTLDGSCTVYGLSNGNNGSKVGWFTLSSVTPGSNQTWNYMGATAIPPTTGTSTTAAAPPTTAASGPPAATTAAAAAPAVSIAPLAVQSCPATAAGSGGFHVAGGQIIGPNGQVWIARGVDVHAANLSAAAQQLPTQFPGVNLVRVAAGDYEPLEDPSSFAGAVTTLTSQGTVVEFTDYSNSLGTGGGGGQGVVFTGALLANELAWFSAMAWYYKNNPYVWLGTNNEPATTGGSLSDWQLATYQAIRNTGNTNPIFLEPSGSRPPGYGGTPLQAAMNPADYTGMTNVIWDPHVYGYQTNYSTDPGTIAAEIVAMVAASQTIQSADGVVPAVIGEYRPGRVERDANRHRRDQRRRKRHNRERGLGMGHPRHGRRSIWRSDGDHLRWPAERWPDHHLRPDGPAIRKYKCRPPIELSANGTGAAEHQYRHGAACRQPANAEHARRGNDGASNDDGGPNSRGPEPAGGRRGRPGQRDRGRRASSHAGDAVRARIAAAIIALAALLTSWLALASMAFLWVLGFWQIYPWPAKLWMWIRYAVEAPPNAIVHRWLIISAIVASLPFLTIGALMLRLWWWWRANPRRLVPPPGGGLRPIEGGVTANYGCARILTEKECLERYPGPTGVVIGELRTGQAGTAPLVIDPCATGAGHGMLIAGTRSGKTTSACTALLHWLTSAIVLDPSAEMGVMLGDALRANGQTVHLLNPEIPGSGFNALAWIDVTRPLAAMDVKEVISWVFPDDKNKTVQKDGYFEPTGKSLCTAILADLLWSDRPAAEKTLRTFRRLVVAPSLRCKVYWPTSTPNRNARWRATSPARS